MSDQPLNREQSIRWQPCRNIGGIDIPPFAALVVGEHGKAVRNAKDKTAALTRFGMPYLPVRRATAADLAGKDTALIVFAGRKIIRKDASGNVTCDFPTRVIFDAGDYGSKSYTDFLTSNTLDRGDECGPKANSFYFSKDGRGFTCLGHCEDQATGLSFVDGVVPKEKETIFVRERFGSEAKYLSDARVLADPVAVAADGTFLAAEPDAGGKFAGSQSGFTVNTSTKRYTADEGSAGRYQAHLAATICGVGGDVGIPATVPRGAALLIAVSLYSSAGVEKQRYTGFRENDIETDQYGNNIQLTKENVAVPGLFDVAEGDYFQLRNVGAYTTTVYLSIFTLVRFSGG